MMLYEIFKYKGAHNLSVPLFPKVTVNIKPYIKYPPEDWNATCCIILSISIKKSGVVCPPAHILPIDGIPV
jgi:hypothetical protein